MKRLVLLCFVLGIFLLHAEASGPLDEFLKKLEITDLRILEKEYIYDKIYEIMIQQPVDHHNPEGPKFSQRLYISHIDPSKPVVFVTEGYHAKYYFTTEIAAELKCNQVIVEHRYFGRSTPDSLDWDYMNTWQAASDHHRIVQLFREIYPEKWISTGISKGGQSLIYHSFYYPEDVDVRIPYVAPLNFSIEDERIYTFLDNVGTGKERRRVKRFQKMALRHQEKYLPAFQTFSQNKGYTYEIAGGYEKAFEYCILEYSFSFWQWDYVPYKKIPGPLATPKDVIQHMNRVAGFDYFTDDFINENRPHFYQAMTEMGYYGFELEEFGDLIRHIDNSNFSFTLPKGIEVSYQADVSQKVQYYLAHQAENFIFIYGENDTWSATGVDISGNPDSRVFVKEDGSHRTRINNMPKEMKQEIYHTISTYLE